MAGWRNERIYVRARRIGYGEAREIETSRRFRDECNGCKNECQGVAPESSRQIVPILRTLLSPSSTFAIAIIKSCFTERVRLEREASGLHNSWNSCSIAENAAETISEGLKS